MKQIKLFLLASILAVFMISCSSSNEPDINDPDSIPDPQYLWKIDIKTKFADKAEIKGAKAGLKGLLSETNWGSVVNIGEDCSVWIGDITKTDKGGNKYDVDFTLYLCPPSALSQGESIKEKSFSINYDLDDFEYDEEGNITEEAMIGIVTKLGTVAGAAFGIPYAGAAISFLSGFITGEESSISSQQQKAESLIIGGMCFGQLKLWLNEIEATF